LWRLVFLLLQPISTEIRSRIVPRHLMMTIRGCYEEPAWKETSSVNDATLSGYVGGGNEGPSDSTHKHLAEAALGVGTRDHQVRTKRLVSTPE